MKIILTSETSIRLIPEPGAMTIEAESAEQQYSPFHMLGSSLAFCTFSVMYSWATHVKIPVDDLTLDVSWEFAEDPHRVGALSLSFDWPSLPEKRINAAKRAAELCTIHATLTHPPAVHISASSEGRPMTDSTTRSAAGAARAASTSEASTASSTSNGDRAADRAVDRSADRTADGSADHHDDGAADLPPKPVQQGDGQEAGTARPAAPDTASNAGSAPGAEAR